DQLTAQQAVLQAQGSAQTAQNNLVKGQAQIATDQQNVFQAQTELNNAQNTANSAGSALAAASSNLSQAIADCSASPVITAPPPPFGGQAQTMLPLPFGFKCLNDVAPSIAKQTEVGARITAYNGSVGSYNTAATGLQTKANAVQTASTALLNDQNNLASLQTALQTSQAGLQTAQQKYQDTVAPPKQADIDASQSSLEAAKKSLETAQARYEQLLKPKPDAVLPLQAAVDQASAQMETAKKLLGAATITAPFDGQISQVNGEVGTQIASNTVVFILLNPRTLRIDANVDQAYVSDLRSTQTANVTFDALQGRSYQATVTAVGLTPTVQQGVVSYVVTLGIDTTRIPQGTPVPTPGMTASITIQTSRTENALSIPARSVRRIGRNQTVTVKTPTGTEQRTVTTGATNGTLIQITSGLTDSDEVLVTAPAASTTQRPAGAIPFGPP
ncbi:MAG TPA: efflux RND transporter periplasmic adaptor subunit, partial [Dehalococcoidia bacterium]|nr:efflux RND transporter periplasmic adaptor subunit [Dehalococcoidia bacterium]